VSFFIFIVTIFNSKSINFSFNFKIAFVLIFSGTMLQAQTKTIMQKYPETKKVDSIDTYFGNQVSDPYRWLEDDRSAETEAWVKAEN